MVELIALNSLKKDQKNAFTFSKNLDNLLGDNGILLYPTYSGTAPKHRIELTQPWNIFDFCYTIIFNASEHPVTQCPLGLDSNGLPLGVQVVVKKGNDILGIQVANYLETIGISGWTPREIIDDEI